MAAKKKKHRKLSDAVLMSRAADAMARLVRRHREAFEALSAEAESLRAALEALPQGVSIVDGDDKPIFRNARRQEIYGPNEPPPGDAVVRRRGVATLPDDRSAWTVSLADGRTIAVQKYPTSLGGWLCLHDEAPEQRNEAQLAFGGLSLQALIDLVPDYLWIKDAECRFVVANDATARQLGLLSPRQLIGKTDLDVHPPDRSREFQADERRILATGTSMIDKEERVVSPEGQTVWLSTTKVPLRAEKGEIIGLFGVSRVITARKKSDRFREEQAQILEMIALSAPLPEVLDKLLRLIETQLDGVYASVLLIDEDGRHLRHGAAPSLPAAYVAAIDGIEIGPSVGSCGTACFRRERVVVPDVGASPLWADYRDLALSFGLRSCASTPIVSHQGAVLGTFALYSGNVREPVREESRIVDLATHIAGIAIERKQAEDRIHFMATHDPLTGLPDRALLAERVTQAIGNAARHERLAAVAFVDLDHFKTINDSLGHKAGDEILKVVAGRMRARVGGADTILRIGGDEFVLVISDKDRGLQALVDTVESARAAIAEPIQVEGHRVQMTSSVGVAFYPRDAANADALVANADSAMYHAKELGRNTLQFYDPALNSKAQERFVVNEQLRGALARGEFALFFQPQIALKSGEVLAVEALIRWNHPERGVLTPDYFVPLAEETGLITAIGEWVIDEACRQNKAWQDAGLPPIRIGVNISARQFADKRLVAIVAAALAHSGLEPRYLDLELTENVIMRDIPQAIATMNALKSLNVQLSIDDFGTGFSGLSALKFFPVARLKIDRSFIKGLPDDDEDAAVTSTVIALAQKLNLKVIAEGVENERQSSFLTKHMCDEIQGYYIGRPVPIGQIEAMLTSLRAAAQVEQV